MYIEGTSTKVSIQRIKSSLTTAGISTAIPETNGLRHLLQHHHELLTTFYYKEPVLHNAKRSIYTNGPPVYANPRRLLPEKYKIHMLELGIIRPSSSPYTTSLHMVPKGN